MKIDVEKSLLWTSVAAFALFAVGAVLTTIVPPMVDPSLWTTDKEVHEYTEQELRASPFIKVKAVYTATPSRFVIWILISVVMDGVWSKPLLPSPGNM